MIGDTTTMSNEKSLDYSITFACYNSVEYTKKCIDSMIKSGDDLSRLVIVDNGSTDQTQMYLQSLPLGGLILNKTNLGCGVAWNQGAMSLQSEWTIIMNNDVIVSDDWIENLIGAAKENNVKVISPALIEGDLDYDFDAFSTDAVDKLHGYTRVNDKHAVCLAIHESVWAEVGYFQAAPKLLGYEDTIFFNELEKAHISTAITGSSWLHHYGSITQSAMKKERGLRSKDGLAYRYNSKLLKQNWIKRKINKLVRKKQQRKFLEYEMDQFGISLHGVRKDGRFEWHHLL